MLLYQVPDGFPPWLMGSRVCAGGGEGGGLTSSRASCYHLLGGGDLRVHFLTTDFKRFTLIIRRTLHIDACVRVCTCVKGGVLWQNPSRLVAWPELQGRPQLSKSK